MDTIYIGSEWGTRFAALFFFGVSAGIGYVIYALLARPETRRAEFLKLGAVPRRSALVIATVCSAAIFLLICRAMLTGFSRIEVAGELLRLSYVFPRRTVEIRRDQLTLLEKQYAYKVSWRLAITTHDGQVHESQPSSAAAIEAARLRVAQLAAE